MRYFNYDDNEEFRDEVDSFFADEKDDELEEELDDLLVDPAILTELSIASSQDVDARLLDTARQICEKSFFWRFTSDMKKIERIAIVFGHLQILMGIEE